MSTAVGAAENFPVGSLLIRPDLRAAVQAFYRFARTADHLADDPSLSTAGKLDALARFEAGLHGDAAGAPEGLLLRAVLAPLDKLALTAHGDLLLSAFRQDAVGATYRTWADLLAYCARSANPVGGFLLDLHGEGRDGRRASDALCTALQILNHLQDLRDDHLRLGRVYLPADELAAAGATPADLSAPCMTPGLRAAVAAALDRIDALLDTAGELPGRLVSPRLAGEARTIGLLAGRLSARLRRGDPLARPVRLTRVDFALAGLAGGWRALRPRRAAGVAAPAARRRA